MALIPSRIQADARAVDGVWDAEVLRIRRRSLVLMTKLSRRRPRTCTTVKTAPGVWNTFCH